MRIRRCITQRSKSSNDFETESLGVVAGMPHPGDDLVRLWAGLCGEPVEITRSDDVDVEKSFGDLGDKIYQYFAHDQVVQAVLRFGRDETVFENGGATVYISTYALPDWFEIEAEFNVQSRELEGAVLAKLFEIFQQEDKPDRALRSITKIHELVNEDDRLKADPSKKGVRDAIKRVVEKDYVTTEPDRGKYSADLYRWDGDGEILRAKDGTTLLHVQDDIHVLQLGESGDSTPGMGQPIPYQEFWRRSVSKIRYPTLCIGRSWASQLVRPTVLTLPIQHTFGLLPSIRQPMSMIIS